MKKSIKKIISFLLCATAICTMFVATISVNAEVEEKVRVIIENNVFSEENGAKWDGTLVDEWVNIDENSTMLSSVILALDNHGYSQTGAEVGYIEEINGLSAYDNGSMSGWVGTLNDWFTNEAFTEYTVANGKLQNGDEIRFMYSNNYGQDAGSSWNDNIAALKSVDFSAGEFSANFDTDTLEYCIFIPESTAELLITPSAVNKNYQVRTYINEYTPNLNDAEIKRTEFVSLKDGDTIYIGVGNSNWPTMNYPAEEKIYKFNIMSGILGDVNQDFLIDINDCTLVQRYMAKIVDFSEKQIQLANFDKTDFITINDVTKMQRKIAGYDE